MSLITLSQTSFISIPYYKVDVKTILFIFYVNKYSKQSTQQENLTSSLVCAVPAIPVNSYLLPNSVDLQHLQGDLLKYGSFAAGDRL